MPSLVTRRLSPSACRVYVAPSVSESVSLYDGIYSTKMFGAYRISVCWLKVAFVEITDFISRMYLDPKLMLTADCGQVQQCVLLPHGSRV